MHGHFTSIKDWTFKGGKIYYNIARVLKGLFFGGYVIVYLWIDFHGCVLSCEGSNTVPYDCK